MFHYRLLDFLPSFWHPICKFCYCYSFSYTLTLFLIVYIITVVAICTHLHPDPNPFPSSHHHTYRCLWVMHMCFLANPFTLFHPVSFPPSPLTAVSLFHMYMSLFLFCSLHSTYEWDHMMFVFHWLASFT